MSEEYFSQHLSLSEWAIRSNISIKEKLISEDATKRSRLEFLNKTIRLPIIKTYSFNFYEINQPSSSFLLFTKIAGDRFYALRANPNEEGLPVLRNRKKRVDDLIKWLLSSSIDFDKYEFSFELHIDPDISSIFIVNDHGILGEAISGGILQLIKGIHDVTSSIYFQYDFSDWKFSHRFELIEEFLREAVRFITVKDAHHKGTIKDQLNGSFINNLLIGYFEVIRSEQSGLIFIDYNRILQSNSDGLNLFGEQVEDERNILKGTVGSIGKIRGKAKVILETELKNAEIGSDEILICHFTSPELVPLIIRAAAVVTDVGGILSHAAIVCRELKKPCIIATRVGTELIKNGDFIEVDGSSGFVRLLHPYTQNL